MLATGYYGLFRVGELANGTHTIMAKDVHYGRNKFKIQFVLWSSKNLTKGSHPQMVSISAADPEKLLMGIGGNTLCPYSILCRYIEARLKLPGRNSRKEKFFVFSDRSAVQPYQFRKILKDTLKRIGLDQAMYDCHSLRIGRAGDLLSAGLSIDYIKKVGRWKSNAVYKYFK